MATLHVYINGTSVPDGRGLASRLAQQTPSDANETVRYISGCDIHSPYKKDLGKIFSWHLEDQVNDLVQNTILPKLKVLSDKNEKLMVKVYGLSRGGIGAFLFCQKVKHISSEKLEIYLATIDPAPGNFKVTGWVDKFLNLNYTLTNRSADLSDCKNLKGIFIILASTPYQPGYAGLLPILPPDTQCQSKIEIISGQHGDLERKKLAELQIHAFLNSCDATTVTEQNKAQLIAEYEIECHNAKNNERGMHLGNQIITRREPQRIYWNTNHQRLVGVPENPNTCVCTLKDRLSYRKSRIIMLQEALRNLIWVIKFILKLPLSILLKYAALIRSFKPRSQLPTQRLTPPSAVIKPPSCGNKQNPQGVHFSFDQEAPIPSALSTVPNSSSQSSLNRLNGS